MNVKIRCLNTKNLSYDAPLTLNKYYVVVSENDPYLTIVDDNGGESTYFSDRFTKIQDERNMRISELLNG
mgnify:CR=1 FL=1|jgi:hypothetical protein